jgi:FHS family L-fucose permease-like MFS transporter
MAIVGGALCPILMGFIADQSNMQMGFLVPMVCFAIVLYYGFSGYKVKTF